jgi:hypothetical protein
MRLVGYQPQYFPRLHYFARVLDSDIFTISDYLQYVRHHVYEHGSERERGPSYQAHTPLKTGNGVLLLDVPVRRGGEEGKQLLTEAQVDYSTPWNEKHLQNIEHHYKKTPEFFRVFPSLQIFLQQRHATLSDLTTGSIVWGLSQLFETAPDLKSVVENIPHPEHRLRRIVLMSETGIVMPDKESGRDANDWIIETCKALGATEYHFGGTSASAYMDFPRFERSGIALRQQDWKCAPYRQQFPKQGFVPNLSIIDLLMNVPPADARKILSA